MKTFIQQAPTFLFSVASKLLERITQKHSLPPLPPLRAPICAPHLGHLRSPPQPTCLLLWERGTPAPSLVIPLGCVLAPVCRCPPRELAPAPTHSGRGSRRQHLILTPRVWGGRHPQPWLISLGFGGWLSTQLLCRLPFYLPWWLRGKASACNAGDRGSIPGSGRSPGEGNGNLLQFSCLENSMGYNPRGCKESDTTEQFHFLF